VLAVRFALLTRSPQLEKSVVAATPTWVGGTFDMSAVPDWQHYRYRVFESVVAMRNMLWGSNP
jgi:type IV pilus assembly protein PilW